MKGIEVMKKKKKNKKERISEIRKIEKHRKSLLLVCCYCSCCATDTERHKPGRRGEAGCEGQGREESRGTNGEKQHNSTHTHHMEMDTVWMDSTYIKTSCGNGDGRGEETTRLKG